LNKISRNRGATRSYTGTSITKGGGKNRAEKNGSRVENDKRRTILWVDIYFKKEPRGRLEKGGKGQFERGKRVARHGEEREHWKKREHNTIDR